MLTGLRFALALVLAIASGSCRSKPTAPAESPGMDTGDTVRWTWVGDTLVAGDGAKVLRKHEPAWPFAKVRSLIQGDYAIANVEGPITADTAQYFPDQKWNYNAPPHMAKSLADIGIDAVSLGNNHLLDRGPDGVADTLKHLSQVGIATFGAGVTSEAERPHFVDTRHGKVAIVAFSVDKPRDRASAEQIGVIPLNAKNFERGHRLAKEGGARFVVAYPHWGRNYSAVNKTQRRLAKQLVEIGYDLVVGHHPHVPQRVERIDDVFVFYSLGNFVFSTRGRYSKEHPGRGLVLHSELDANGFVRFELTCILTDNRTVKYQPRPCEAKDSEEMMARLGSEVRFVDGVGVVQR